MSGLSIYICKFAAALKAAGRAAALRAAAGVFMVLACAANAYAASELADFKITEREQYIDVFLSFSEPYDEEATIIRSQNFIALKLPNLRTPDERNIALKSPLASAVRLHKAADSSLLVEFVGAKNAELQPARAKDFYSLNIKLLREGAALPTLKREPEAIEFKDESELGGAALKMSLVLAVLVGILLWLKRKIKRKNELASSQEFLDEFGAASAAAKQKTSAAAAAAQQAPRPSENPFLNQGAEDEAKIIHEQFIDGAAKFVILEHAGEVYKLVLGENFCTLLAAKSARAAESFEENFAKNQARINEMLRQKSLQDYKEKVSVKKESE